MKRAGILAFAVILNALLWLNAVAPRYVTWAEVVPKVENCAACSSPEVQKALVRAAAQGRSQVVSAMASADIIFAMAALNVALIGALLFIPALTTRSSGRRCAAPLNSNVRPHMRVLRDFRARPKQEQQWFAKETWCDVCQVPDLGMFEPVEYEEGGRVFVEGRCTRCGSPVVTEIVDK